MSAHPTMDALLDYVAGDPKPDEDAPLEEHLFECEACAATAAALAQVGDGVRAAVASGRTGLVASEALLAKLEEAGVRLRHYEVEPGGEIDCTVAAEDVFVVAHYSADFSGVEQVTLVAKKGDQELRRMEGIRVPPGARTLHVLLRGDFMRTLPTATHTVTLSSGEHVVAEYTFSHTRFRGH